MTRKMMQRTSPSNNRRKVSDLRDFPYRCGTQSIKSQRNGNGSEVVSVTSDIRQKLEVEPLDVIMKKAGFNLTANGNGRFVSAKREFPPSCGSKVKPLSLEESIKLIASQRRQRRRQLSDSSSNFQGKHLPAKAVQKQKNSPDKKKKKKKSSNATALRANTHKPTQNRDERPSNQHGLILVRHKNQINKSLSPREKVLKVLRLFRLVFKELDRDKAARRGESKTATSRIDYHTRSILMSEGMQVNVEKRIGPVPGIEVGDEFQYKSELNLIGLHFDIMGGIDYINRGDMKLATSIVSSEGNGYNDRFDADVMIYSGQGGNVTSKDQKVIEDQKLVTGNLALANSMRAKNPVRVIRGKKRWDQRGKRYVYVGLFLVQDYWKEKGHEGNVLFKFKLCRVPGQPSVDWRH